jgi:amino acid transporter
MAFASVVLSYGAVARALGRNLSYIAPSLSAPLAQGALAAAVVVALALLNWRGVKPGAVASDVFSGAKLLPLLGFVAVGLFFIEPQRLAVPPPHGESTWTALRLGGLAGLFACSGFEYVPVPAGETDNPRRNVPLALLGALLGAVLLYALVQIVFMGTHPDPTHADKPLAEAAAAFAGPWAARLLTVGAAVSSFGFCTGVALVGPRYLSALADDGLLPSSLGRRHPRFATPGVAIVVTAAVTVALVLWADFDRLSDLGNVAVFAQYLSTCLAVPVLRWLNPDMPRRFRLPFGPLVPLAGTAGCLLFLKDMKWEDLRFALVTLACGLVLFAALRRARKAVPGGAP